MSFNRPVFSRPWNWALALSLFLGVCFFHSWGATRSFALDSGSALFDQGKTSPTGKNDATQPMALPEETPNPSPGIFFTLKVILALILTCGLVVATVWVLKLVWGNRGWSNLAEDGKPVKVLATTYLAPRKAVYLVEVGKRILVVGVGNDEMTRLDVITDPSEVEALKNGTQQGFPKVFGRLMQKQEAAAQEEETKRMMQESKDMVGGYLAKLKKISKKKKADSDGVDEEA